MILSYWLWDKIRADFTLREQLELSIASNGESTCPRGMLVEDEKLTPELKTKLETYKKKSIQELSGLRIVKS